MKDAPFHRAPTAVLKTVIILIGAMVIALYGFFLPYIVQGGLRELPEFTAVLYPAFIGLTTSIVPFFLALFQTFLLLRYIDTDKAFSDLSVNALNIIKYSAIAFSISYAMCMPLVYVLADLDDAPGAILIAMAFVLAPLIVATFAAVLQKLVHSAVVLKAENELTI